MKNLDDVLAMLEKENADELGEIHFGHGMRLRNELGLWGKNELTEWFNSIGITHADDMSGIIYTSLHRKLNGKPIDLEGQVKFYQDYWKKMGYADGKPK
jgi:hypothetical protein